jgi:acyl-coenzyme A synthetase/AMP-(fatty) acid ligase
VSEWLGLGEVASRTGEPARPVARRRGELLTHDRFVAQAARWQAAFAAQPGRRFALFFDDAFEFAAALYGAWHAGKQPVLPGDAQPLTIEALRLQVDGWAGDVPQPTVQPAGAGTAARAALDLHEARVSIFTSGSSGQPVAIDKRLAQLDAEVRHLEQVFGHRLGQDAILHATVSHQHIYGLLFCVLWPLASGRVLDVQRLVYPEEMAARLAGHASALVSSPAHLKRLPDHLDWSGARASLKAIFSSGGPLPPESAGEAFALLGQSPIEVFGSSETGGIAWRQRATHGDRWTPLPGVDCRIDDEVLHVRSAHLADEGWWETADRARTDAEGGFVLLGRADRIVKIEEKRVSLTGLEQALVASGLVHEARALMVEADGASRLAVVAVPSETGWRELRAAGKRAFNERLRGELLQRVERVALPRRFRYVRQLPSNSQGKVTEALLAALFASSLPPVQWRERDDRHASLTLTVTPDLRVLDGHFPGVPVLPGVAQVDWAIAFAGQCFALPPRFVRIEVLKFQSPVIPPSQLDLALEWDAERSSLQFRYSSASGPHSSGRLVFAPADV